MDFATVIRFPAPQPECSIANHFPGPAKAPPCTSSAYSANAYATSQIIAASAVIIFERPPGDKHPRRNSSIYKRQAGRVRHRSAIMFSGPVQRIPER